MYVIVLAIILIFALIPVGVFADENKALDVQLTKLELQNDKGETITETSIGSSFKLFANYTINDTITSDNNDIVFYSMLLMFTTAMIVRFKKKNN